MALTNNCTSFLEGSVVAAPKHGCASLREECTAMLAGLVHASVTEETRSSRRLTAFSRPHSQLQTYAVLQVCSERLA